MRIGCLQFAPQVGDVDNNLNRADSVLSKANPDDLDVLVLPELAFSGYNFKSLQDISPFLEPSGSGITSLWARTIALKYNCVVTVGYPEKADVASKWPTGPEYYNSTIVVNGDGETIANYRKTFLYQTDESWALEGDGGFFDGWIPGLGNTSIGICMDLNPYRFEAPWNAFEFANHVIQAESNLVIVSMAWMTREDPRNFSRMPNEPDMETLTYWVTRLEPLIRSDNEDEVIVIFCNRTGNEDQVTYAGTSAVVGIQDGEVKVYGLLGRGQKELLVIDTNDAPYAKLVHRPEPDARISAPVELEKQPSPDQSKKEDFYGKPKPNLPRAGWLEGDSPNTASPSSPAMGLRMGSLPLGSLPFIPPKPTPKRRPGPAISIPEVPALGKPNSALEAGTDSPNVPTPSAPSPTPVAVRPRLIIPESPPVLPHQFSPTQPISAASLRSVASYRSVMSNESTQTIRSNPRPPEESTPYPRDDLPQRGFPKYSFKTGVRIYGGRVTITNGEDGFQPETPFDEASPVSPDWSWRPDEPALSAGGWGFGSPIGRRPEPFPWPDILPTARPENQTQTLDQQIQKTPPRQELTQANQASVQHSVQTPKSNASSDKTTQAMKAANSEFAAIVNGNANKKHERDRTPARPSSPKSRNASRSGMRERSNSAFGEPNLASALSHLEGISQRAESVSKMRRESVTGTPKHERSQSQSNSGNPVRDGQMIHIAASPSILSDGDKGTPAVKGQESRSSFRPMSRASFHQRSNSSASLKSGKMSNSMAKPHRPASRAASRGRTPGPKIATSSSQSQSSSHRKKRSSSTDTTRNDILYSRNDGRQSHSRQSRPERRASSSNLRRATPADLAAGFERVESVVHDNCPVHGRRSSSLSVRNENSTPLSQTPPRRSLESEPARARPADPPRYHEEPARGQQVNGVRVPKALSMKTHASRSTDRAGANERSSSAETFQTVSTPGRVPGTPSRFNPRTPKAMAIKLDNTDVDVFPGGQLSQLNELGLQSIIRYLESDGFHTMELPPTTMA